MVGLKYRVDLVSPIWLSHCSDFGDFQGRPKEAILVIDVSTWDTKHPLWEKGG